MPKRTPVTVEAAKIGAKAQVTAAIIGFRGQIAAATIGAGAAIVACLIATGWHPGGLTKSEVAARQLAILPEQVMAAQGYRSITSKWFTAKSVDAMSQIVSDLQQWNREHDLYLTTDGRVRYNVLIGAMRYALAKSITDPIRIERAKSAANLIWEFREILISGSWYASASRGPVTVLGE